MQVRLDGETGPRHRCAAAAPPQEAMSPHRFSTLISFTVLLLLLVSCDRPQLQVKSVNEAPPETVAASPTVVTETPGDSPVPALPEPETAPRAEEEPELFVEKSGDRIIVKGALRSRIQQERIVETLRREFPNAEVESDLRVESHRIPAGWGNRIADELLVPYLTKVADAKFTYKDSVITLEGKVGKGEHMRITEMVINTMSDGNATDLQNKLEVGGAKK